MKSRGRSSGAGKGTGRKMDAVLTGFLLMEMVYFKLSAHQRKMCPEVPFLPIPMAPSITVTLFDPFSISHCILVAESSES